MFFFAGSTCKLENQQNTIKRINAIFVKENLKCFGDNTYGPYSSPTYLRCVAVPSSVQHPRLRAHENRSSVLVCCKRVWRSNPCTPLLISGNFTTRSYLMRLVLVVKIGVCKVRILKYGRTHVCTLLLISGNFTTRSYLMR